MQKKSSPYAMLILGSSPSALDKDLSNQIDSFERVVRFNCYELGPGFRQLGTKEDTWAANLGLICHIPTVEKYMQGGRNRHLWYVGNNYAIEDAMVKVKRRLKTQFVVESINFGVTELVSSLRPELKDLKFIFYKNKIRVGEKSKYATTGLRAIIKGIASYGHVYIHGFDFYQNSPGAASHYYGISKVPEHMHKAFSRDPNFEHDVATEKKVVARLEELGLVTTLKL